MAMAPLVLSVTLEQILYNDSALQHEEATEHATRDDDAVAEDDAAAEQAKKETDAAAEDDAAATDQGEEQATKEVDAEAVDDATTADQEQDQATEEKEDPAQDDTLRSSYTVHYNPWDMLEPSIPGVCGHQKCFFRAKSDPTRVGLALCSYRPNRMEWAWRQAKKLQDRYGARHIYLEPPKVMKRVSREAYALIRATMRNNYAEKTMHQKLKIEDFIHLTEADTKGLKQTGEGDNWMMVQKVRVVPLPFLEIGHGSRRERKVEEGWDSFRKAIHNKTSFSDRLLEEERNMAELLEQEVWLKQHFQLLIDTTGRITHLDLERGYHYATRNSKLHGILLRRENSKKNTDVSYYLTWIRAIAMRVSQSNFTGNII